MLSWSLLFFILALVAGALGFGVIGGVSYTLAKIFFVLFLIVFIVSLLRGRTPSAV